MEKREKKRYSIIKFGSSIICWKSDKSIEEGIELAAEIIDSKRAMEKVYELRDHLNYLNGKFKNIEIAL